MFMSDSTLYDPSTPSTTSIGTEVYFTGTQQGAFGLSVIVCLLIKAAANLEWLTP